MPPAGELRYIHVALGEVALAQEPSLIQTLLGSCVAAVFWSRSHRVGAMCHGSLPVCTNLAGSAAALRLRYVDYAIHYLAEQFDLLGIKRNEIELKLFGGADVLPVSASPAGHPTVGAQNVMAAMRTLQHESLYLKNSDVGGVCARVIYFRTDTGEVTLRRLPVLQGLQHTFAG